MFSIRNTLTALLALSPLASVSAIPTSVLQTRSLRARQAMSTAGLTDLDILQFALTAEHLESSFYNEGFTKFSSGQFASAGLSSTDLQTLKDIGVTEQDHESFLLSAIAGQGAFPVQPCKYNFGLSSPQQMVQIARVLEAVGISAYLGAAPAISTPSILQSAAEIVTVESRHQTFIRSISGAQPVPAPFDTPLGPRAVFSLLSSFVQSCPSGSTLNISPFTSIQLDGADAIKPGQALLVENGNWPSGAKFCTFINQNLQQFAPVNSDGSCEVPQNLAGETYMFLTTSQSAEDNAIVAGPSILSVS